MGLKKVVRLVRLQMKDGDYCSRELRQALVYFQRKSVPVTFCSHEFEQKPAVSEKEENKTLREGFLENQLKAALRSVVPQTLQFFFF